MEKNNENNDKQSVSKAVAHEVENQDVVFATAYAFPPPLHMTADPTHSRQLVKEEEKESKSPEQQVTQAKEATQLKAETQSNDAPDAVQPQQIAKEEEPEEELKESSNIELLFADEAPEAPNEEGEDENGAAGDGDSSGNGDGNPVQKKEGNAIASAASSPSSKVPVDVMQKMEATLGADFSNVKINTNSSKAKESGALAYTQGNSIDFAPGQFKPNTNEGQKLLGHELTHVVQQRKGRVKPTTSINGMAVNDNPGLEKEADDLGAKAASSTIPTQKKVDVATSANGGAQMKFGPFKDGYEFGNDESQPAQGIFPLLIYGAAALAGTALGIGAGAAIYSTTDDHRERNAQNQFPEGILTRQSTGEAGDYTYIEGAENIFVDNTGREWRLLPDSKNIFHQPDDAPEGTAPNKKFLAFDGELRSFEAILQPNLDGTYTDNWLNSGSKQGTYNYYDPDVAPIRHGLYDVLPHMIPGGDNYSATPVSQQKTESPTEQVIQREGPDVTPAPSPPVSPPTPPPPTTTPTQAPSDNSTPNPPVATSTPTPPATPSVPPTPAPAPTPANATPNATPSPNNQATNSNSTPTPVAAPTPEVVSTPAPNTIDRTNANSGVDWGKFWEDNKLNIGRTVAEPFRLIPVWGLFPGFAADIMETIGDLDTAKPANDKFLDFLIAIRSPVVLMHNMFGHFAYIGELAQDVAVGSILGIELAAFTGPFNETMNSIKLGLLTAQTVIDAGVVARTMMEMSDASHTQTELDAYKQTFAGFEANLAMDGIDFILTGLSAGSAGLANGSVISQGARVGKNLLKQKALYKSVVENVIIAWTGVWGGNAVDAVLPDPVAQPKASESEPLQRQGGGNLAREVAGEIILAELSMIEGAYNIGTGIIEYQGNQIQDIGNRIDELSEVLTDEKAIPALKTAMNKGLDFLVKQLTGLQQTQPFATDAHQKAVALNEMLDGVLETIDTVPLLKVTQSTNDLIPDAIEEAGAAAANRLLAEVNELITEAKTQSRSAIQSMKDNSEEIAEFLQVFSEVLSGQIDFVIEKIADFQEYIQEADTLTDFANLLMAEISEFLGIDPPLSAELIKEGWDDLHHTIQGGFDWARTLVNENIKGEAVQGKFIGKESNGSEKETSQLRGAPLMSTEHSKPTIEAQSTRNAQHHVISSNQPAQRQEIIQKNDPTEDENELAVIYPFDIGTARSFGEAADNSNDLHDKVRDLNRALEDHDNYRHDPAVLNSLEEKVWNMGMTLGAAHRDGSSFEAVPVFLLRTHLDEVEATYNSEFSTFKSFLQRHLSRIRRTAKIDPMTEAMAEAKRKAFSSGDEGTLEKITKISATAGKYNANVSKWIGYAGRISDKVSSSEDWKKLKDATGNVGKLFGHATKVFESAKVIMELVGSGKTEEEEAIQNVENGLKAIDIGMSFVKGVPLLGTLWSRYYYPMASKCLRLISKISAIKGRENRQLTGVISDWHSPRPPRISSLGFPGGQSVFSFMWHLFFGTYAPSSSAKEYFYDNSDDFNAGTRTKLKTERSGFLWLDKDVLNLETWATENKQDIWFMLYGADMPFPGDGAVAASIRTYNDDVAQRSIGTPMQLKPSGANKIPGDLQSNIEQNIGMSMDGVNIHTNSNSATDAGALAYSQGKDIHFAPGQFNPGTKEGDHLIAHEAAHLTQKSGLEATTEVNGMPVNDDPGLEAEADAIADKVVQKKENSSLSIPSTTNIGNSNTIQRFEIPNPLDWASDAYDSVSDAYNGAKEDHYNRNDQNQAPATEPAEDDSNWRRLPDSQSVYHQNGEEGKGNRKYVSTDGGNFEAVYDSNGNLVTDDANMGTYNHHGPDDAWGHWKEDVLPYWLWGNTEEDDTPLLDRLVGPRILERGAEMAGDAWDSATGAAENAWDTVSETASGAWESTKETAGDAWDSTKATANDVYDSASETASNVVNTVSEGASNAWDKTTDVASSVSNSVSETAGDAYDAVSGATSSAWDSVTSFFGGGDDPIQEKEDPAALQRKEVFSATSVDDSNNVGQLKESDIVPSGVSIHKESSQATEMGALAYAQGSDIHFAPGQFKLDTRQGQELLGHELGHVVQQKEGRVQPTTQFKGENVNNDSKLEKEADDFGVAFADSLQTKSESPIQNKLEGAFNLNSPSLQKKEASNTASPIQMKEDAGAGGGAGGGTSEGTGPISVEGSQTGAKDLMTSTPLPLFEKIKTAPSSISTAMNGETSALKGSFPTIEQPTGIENKPIAQDETTSGPQGPPNAPFNLQESSAGGANSGPGGNSLNVPHPGAFGPGAGANVPVQGPPAPETIIPEASAPPTTSVSIGEDNVDFSAGQRPEINLSGEADPGQMDTDKSTKTSEVQSELNTANQDITKDHGENDIYPHYDELEQLTPQVDIPQAPTVEIPEMQDLSERRPEVDTAFNLHAQDKLNEDMAEHLATNEAEVEKMKSGSQEEWTNYETEKSTEEARIKTEQETAQSTAKTEVETQKTNWQTENDAVKSKFVQDADIEKSNFQTKIDTEITSTDRDVENTLAQAETEAAAKANDAEQEASAKEAEAEEKKSGGFFGWLADKVSKALDWLKDQFNAIIDALKSAVDFIINKAKEAANALIDLARRAITGLIRAFGAALKLLVDIAFAAFPEIRDRIKGIIDRAVETAVEVVNQLADALKDIVSRLLDALGAALKFLLDAYQKYINFLIDAIKFITVGLFKIFQFITNLVVGAWKAPPQFLGCLAEDALGGNPGEPLKDIEVPNGQEDAWARAMGLNTADGEGVVGEEDPLSEQMKGLLTKGELGEDDVMLDPDPAVELSPELLAQLAGLKDGQTQELGGAGGNSVSTEEFQASAADSAGYDISGLDPSLLDQEAVAGPEEEGATPDPDFKSMSDDAKLQYYIAQMTPETEQAATQQPAPGPAAKEAGNTDTSEAALISKTGRLGAGQRLAFMGKQMLAGMKVFWSTYKAWIIGALVTALIAAGAIAFFTGGAGLALAVDIILKAMMVIFGAIAIAKATGHVWQYVQHAWAGNTDAAGKSLAMACAVLVNEFLIDKILMGMGKVFRRTMKAIKASRVGRAAGNVLNVVRRGSSGGTGLVKRGIAGIRGSKLVVGMKNVVGRGVDSFMELRRKILEKFGFDRVWFEKVNKYVELWASFNPKLLLMRMNTDTDQIETKHVDIEDIDTKTFVPDNVGNQQIGRTSPTPVDDFTSSVVVSDDFMRRLNDPNLSPAQKQELLQELQKKIDAGDYKAIREFVESSGTTKFNREEFLQKFPGQEKVADAIQSRSALRDKLGDVPNMDEAFDAHHLIPVGILKGDDGAGELMRQAINDGFDFNDITNGRWAQKYSSNNPADNLGIHASHPSYTAEVRDRLENSFAQLKKPIPDGVAKAEVERVLQDLADDFDRIHAANPDLKVDDYFRNRKLDSEGNEIPGSGGTAREVKITPSSGAALTSNPETTTTILGRWDPDMQKVKPELHPHDHNIGMEHGVKNTNEGGFNFLNIPDELYDPDTFWATHNMPWLQTSIDRGDDLILATIPNSVDEVMNVSTGQLYGMYAHELKFLVDNNYRPTNVTDGQWTTIKSWFS